MQKKWASACHARMVGCSRLPGSHGTAAWQTRNVHETNGHGANISYISYMQGHLIAVVSGYTFEACVLGRFKIVEGSSCSRVVGEVVVHVHLGEVLDESNIFGATVVVHGEMHVDGSRSRQETVVAHGSSA